MKTYKKIMIFAASFLMLISCAKNKDSKTSDSETSQSESGGTIDSGTATPDPSLPDYVNEYYSSIGDNLTGDNLKTALNSLNTSKRKRMIGYDNMRNYFKYTEALPTTTSGKMIGFYNNDLVSNVWDGQATWNHEHVWPNSRGSGPKGAFKGQGNLVEDDIHMVRPAPQSLNSERGNLVFAASGAYDPGQYVAEYRGVAARIILYCAIADTRLGLVDGLDSGNSGKKNMGKLSDLLRWNLQYLPTNSESANLALQVEYYRNEQIYSRSDLQGNRNPFIDHPAYACKIWGSTNATTKQICGM